MMDKPVWEGVYEEFRQVPVSGPGHAGDVWVNNSIKKISSIQDMIRSGKTISGIPGYRESLLPVIAAMVRSKKQTVSILDFGGGLGLTYYHVAHGLPNKDGLQFDVVDIPEVCRSGKEIFSDEPYISFYENLPLPNKKQPYDIVHLGSSLQYIEDWKAFLHELAELKAYYMVFTNLQAGDVPTYATVQNYYGSTMPNWFFNLEEFIAIMRENEYGLIFKSAFIAKILGKEQDYPQDNFDEQYRLGKACNLVFVKDA